MAPDSNTEQNVELGATPDESVIAKRKPGLVIDQFQIDLGLQQHSRTQRDAPGALHHALRPDGGLGAKLRTAQGQQLRTQPPAGHTPEGGRLLNPLVQMIHRTLPMTSN